ncbi:ISL3 family transposase [Vibrio sp.]|uniref:ISL3 family transposase n=1 Tax=Vibrio sp. TaxID=678 RepID=UPI003D0C6678
MGKAEITIPLGIPDVRVLKTEINKKGELIITIESTKKGTNCHRCGKWITKFHGHDDWVEIRHLPVFGRPSYLRYQPKRYRCDSCEKKPTTTQRLIWQEEGSHNTIAYENHILLQLVHSTVEDVRIKEQTSYDRVLGVMERQIDAETDWSRYNEIGRLGLDEIALKKGHRDYVTIVTGRLENDRIVILGVLPDRKKDTVVEFLRSIPVRLVKTIHTVCCDMYEGYTEAVREELPKANIVIDHFHVVQHYSKAADQLRKRELKRLKTKLTEEEYKSLQGNMWAFRKKRDDLTLKERKILQKLFTYSPNLKQAYEFREQLSAIFELDISKTDAKQKLRTWIECVEASDITCFNRFIKTLERWFDEIANFFMQRETSGFVEGFNNKIKVLKRRCYGIFNIQHLYQRIFLDLEGYRLFA